jgi:hypothetical protein
MWHGVWPDVKFYSALVEADEAIVEQVQEAGCPCGGRLDRADYMRKPRGLMADVDPAHCRRFSLCCSREGCRARTCPPSLRFLDRKVYVAAVILLASIAYCQERVTMAASRAATNVAQMFHVPGRTLERWSTYFTTILPALVRFRAERARFMPPLDESLLPLTLLERYSGGLCDRLMQTLRFVAHVTSRPSRARKTMPE